MREPKAAPVMAANLSSSLRNIFRPIPWRAIVVGVVAGALYSMIDDTLDDAMMAGKQTPTIRALHDIVDVVMPVGIGILAAIAVSGLRYRSQLVTVQTARADDLERRIDRLDRNQAVWLVAAATLHRIVNPLHTLGLICDEMAEHDPAFAERARLQVERMSEAMGTLRHMNVQAPQIDALDLGQYATDFASLMAPLGARHHVLVRTQIGKELRVRADRVYLSVILENLIHNGIEALPDGGELTLSIANEDTRGVISVRDTGGGIPEEAREALFEPLRGSTKSSGLGMGLSVSRALARAMGGDLRYVDTPTGARFALSLPLDEHA